MPGALPQWGQTFYLVPFKNWVNRKRKRGFLIKQCLAFIFFFFFNSSFKKGFNSEENNLCHVETFHLYFPEIYYECNKNNQLENAKHFCPTITFRQKIQGRTKISFLTTRLFIGTHLSLRWFISFCFKCTGIAKTEILANISWNYQYTKMKIDHYWLL